MFLFPNVLLLYAILDYPEYKKQQQSRDIKKEAIWGGQKIDTVCGCACVHVYLFFISSVQSLSHVQLFVDPVDYSMPGFPIHHQPPELAKTHVHWVSDAIQPSHPLLSPSPPAFNLSQHQGLFQWVSFSKVLEYVLFFIYICIYKTAVKMN